MCKYNKSFNTWVKVIFRHMKVPCKNVVQAGLRPVPTLWLDQPSVGDVHPGQFKTTRESWRSLSWTWLDSLELCGTPRSYASRFRNCALQRAPVRWTLISEPTIGRSLRPCQSRNGATNSTTAEESFPGDVTQQFQVSTREQPKEHELTTWHPKQRTELTRENEAKASILLTPTESK